MLVPARRNHQAHFDDVSIVHHAVKGARQRAQAGGGCKENRMCTHVPEGLGMAGGGTYLHLCHHGALHMDLFDDAYSARDAALKHKQHMQAGEDVRKTACKRMCSTGWVLQGRARRCPPPPWRLPRRPPPRKGKTAKALYLLAAENGAVAWPPRAKCAAHAGSMRPVCGIDIQGQ